MSAITPMSRNHALEHVAIEHVLDPKKTDDEGMPSRPARRGFAAMDQARQRQIASLGGRTAHQRGQAHEFTSEEARQAGRKGGEMISRNRDYMAAIGRRGGTARGLRLDSPQR
jgi:general stress protein YciG